MRDKKVTIKYYKTPDGLLVKEQASNRINGQEGVPSKHDNYWTFYEGVTEIKKVERKGISSEYIWELMDPLPPGLENVTLPKQLTFEEAQTEFCGEYGVEELNTPLHVCKHCEGSGHVLKKQK
jgi:hypothetical protein